MVFVVSVLSAAGAASVGAAVAALAIGPIAPRNPDIIAIAAALREVISRPLRRGIAAHGSTTSVPAVEPCCGVAGVSVLPLGGVCSPASLISLLPLNKKRALFNLHLLSFCVFSPLSFKDDSHMQDMVNATLFRRRRAW